MREDRQYAWRHLALAILFGGIANSILVRTVGFTRPGPSVLSAVAIVLCGMSLSKVMRVMPVGVAYATYASLTIAITTLVGFCAHRQTPTCYSLLGLAMIVAGVLVLHTAGKKKQKSPEPF